MFSSRCLNTHIKTQENTNILFLLVTTWIKRNQHFTVVGHSFANNAFHLPSTYKFSHIMSFCQSYILPFTILPWQVDSQFLGAWGCDFLIFSFSDTKKKNSISLKINESRETLTFKKFYMEYIYNAVFNLKSKTQTAHLSLSGSMNCETLFESLLIIHRTYRGLKFSKYFYFSLVLYPFFLSLHPLPHLAHTWKLLHILGRHG